MANTSQSETSIGSVFHVEQTEPDHDALETFGGPSCTRWTKRKVNKDAVALGFGAKHSAPTTKVYRRMVAGCEGGRYCRLVDTRKCQTN